VDWDLGALETQGGAGYFRLDDEFEPRLMVKWQPLKGRFDPEGAIRRHFKKRRKDLERAGLRAEPRIGAPLADTRRALKGFDYQTYAIESGEHTLLGVAACCRQCTRAFVAELHSAPGQAADRLVGRVLGSLREHPEGKLARWEFFGVSADLPAELRAAGRRFQQGLVSFAAAERGRRVELCRWTLANVHLASADLRWFLGAYLAKSRGLPRLAIEPAAVMSHPGLVFRSARRILEPVRARLRRGLGVYNPAHVTGLVWHCTASNRIFMLTLGSNQANDIGAARLLASRVRCCKTMY